MRMLSAECRIPFVSTRIIMWISMFQLKLKHKLKRFGGFLASSQWICVELFGIKQRNSFIKYDKLETNR